MVSVCIGGVGVVFSGLCWPRVIGVRAFCMRRITGLSLKGSPCRARLPLLRPVRRALATSADKPPIHPDSDEDIERTALQMSRLIRVLSVSWLGWKLYEILEGGNTWLVAPSLTLVRSRSIENRESGVWRVATWHCNGTALEAVVDQGGIEALLTALPSAKPATRGTIVELLMNSIPHSARTHAASNSQPLPPNPFKHRGALRV